MSFLSLQLICISPCVDGWRHSSGISLLLYTCWSIECIVSAHICTLWQMLVQLLHAMAPFFAHTVNYAHFFMSHYVHWHLSPSLHMLTHWIMPVLYNHHHPTPSLSLQLFFWSQTLEFVLSIGGALLFCGFIIFDTHIIMHKLSAEEYILASINLYLDFINLFIYILRILQSARKDWYCLNVFTHTHTHTHATVYRHH